MGGVSPFPGGLQSDSMSSPLRARPLSGPGPVTMPREFEPRRLLRRTLQVAALVGVLILIVLLAPGLGEVRSKLEGADPAWIAIAIGLEFMSCVSYVVMFRPIFCSAHALAHELGDQLVVAGDGLDRAREWRRRVGARRLDPARGWHAD